MPSHWIVPRSDADVHVEGDLSEAFYGLMGGGITALFDGFPPIFTQVQRLAGVDVDELLPLYVSVEVSEDLEREVRQVRVTLAEAQPRFQALHDTLARRPGWERALQLPTAGYVPERTYFASGFGDDLRVVLRFMERARAAGGTWFWFVGR
jgi:hypothetical protein